MGNPHVVIMSQTHAAIMTQAVRKINFDRPVLTVKGLESKYDNVPISNSLAIVLGSYQEALIVQLIHSWIREGQGIVIDGKPWFDKSIKDWVNEVLPSSSTWKMRSYMNSLVNKGVLERQQLYKQHHGHNLSPKNRTYYYRLDYERLSELVKVAIQAQNLNHAGGEE